MSEARHTLQKHRPIDKNSLYGNELSQMFASYPKTPSGKVIQKMLQSSGTTKTEDVGNTWRNTLFVTACYSRGSEANKNRREQDEKTSQK